MGRKEKRTFSPIVELTKKKLLTLFTLYQEKKIIDSSESEKILHLLRKQEELAGV